MSDISGQPSGSHSEVQFENERFRVTKWTIDPGGHIPMHRHDFDYVVVPLLPGRVRIDFADGSSTEAEQVPGGSYAREAGAEHRLTNLSSTSPVLFVETERLS
ncbi:MULTISPECIES: cupin [unclassified Leucobacter]|uniref:cupin n=1 Tax=unclassified Leucobacter TaxID=2621730 RepID=UPI000621F0DE|nr:cupin [Leucobacter sp. Ag1]KKI16753.1 cupin [Leucobacter sp. Ag1]